MVKVVVDDYVLLCSNISTILNLFKLSGLNDYKFCFHESLPLAGNCRICLIELEDIEKQIAACVTNIENNHAVWTYNPFSKKARENVAEVLLINHPLDCPICDQGGECDLQDQIKMVGSFKNRFFFKKRPTSDKCSGIFIKTIMTRCIHCLRCVRFNKLVERHVFGILNRTNRSEVVYHSFDSYDTDFSGMTIDLCPVGALTGRHYSFMCRPWETKIVESIDATDGFGSNMYVSFKDNEAIKISAKSNFLLNGNIVSDRARFSYDACGNNRLKLSYFYNIHSNDYEKISWGSIFEKLSIALIKKRSHFLINDEIDFNSILYLKKTAYKMCESIRIFCVFNKFRNNFYCNNIDESIASINAGDDLFMLIDINPKYECVLLNLKLRLRYKKALLSLFCFGKNIIDSFFKSISINTNRLIKYFSAKDYHTKKMAVITNLSVFIFGEAIMNYVFNFSKIFSNIKLKIKNIKLIQIFKKINSISLNMTNIYSYYNNKINKSIFLLLPNENISLRRIIFKNIQNLFVLTSFKPKKFIKYNFILPVGIYLENENYYINIDHKIQKSRNFGISIKSLYNVLKSIFNTSYYYTFCFFYQNYFEDYYNSYKKIFSVKNIFNFYEINICFNFNLLPCITKKSTTTNGFINNISKNSMNLKHDYYLVKKKLSNFSII